MVGFLTAQFSPIVDIIETRKKIEDTFYKEIKTMLLMYDVDLGEIQPLFNKAIIKVSEEQLIPVNKKEV